MPPRLEEAPDVEQMARKGAMVCYSVSGGKDSSAAIAATMDQLDAWDHPRDRRMILHADLGRAEWRTTAQQVEDVASHFRLPLHVVKHSTHDMFSRWERRGDLGRERWARYETKNLIGPWSTSALRFCTSELKNHVLGKFKKDMQEPIITVLGIRRDESSGRSRTPTTRADTSMKRYGRPEGDLLWNPIAHWSTKDVFDVHHHRGIKLHEAYGLGSTRLSCNFCIMGSIADLTISADHADNQDAYRYLVGMELHYGFSFQSGRWLADVNPQILDATMQNRVEAAKKAATRRRELEALYPDGLKTKPWTHITMEDARQIASIRQEITSLYDIREAITDAHKIYDIHHRSQKALA